VGFIEYVLPAPPDFSSLATEEATAAARVQFILKAHATRLQAEGTPQSPHRLALAATTSARECGGTVYTHPAGVSFAPAVYMTEAEHKDWQ
jgi:hypothetical protein